MKKYRKFILLLFSLPFMLSLPSCANSKVSNNNEVSKIQSESPKDESNFTSQSSESEKTYKQISPEEAKNIMDTQREYIIIDARTEEEFAQGHIKNAILIPEYEIKDKAEKALPDKNSLILVYCRSGRRSKIASEALVELGYTNVYEFGGIIDWKYEIVK